MQLTGAQLMRMAMPMGETQKSPLRLLVELDLPAALSLRLARLARDLQAEIDGFEAIRQRYVEKYGEPDKRGGLRVKDECLPDFTREWTEALKEEVEISREPINIPDMLMAGLKLPPFAIIALEPAVTFGEPEKLKPKAAAS